MAKREELLGFLTRQQTEQLGELQAAFKKETKERGEFMRSRDPADLKRRCRELLIEHSEGVLGYVQDCARSREGLLDPPPITRLQAFQDGVEGHNRMIEIEAELAAIDPMIVDEVKAELTAEQSLIALSAEVGPESIEAAAETPAAVEDSGAGKSEVPKVVGAVTGGAPASVELIEPLTRHSDEGNFDILGDRPVVSLRTAAKFLGKSERTVRRWMHDKDDCLEQAGVGAPKVTVESLKRCYLGTKKNIRT
jgi:hypothetical protein